MSPTGPAGRSEVLLQPGVQQVAAGQVPGGDPAALAADLGADLLDGQDGLPALLARRDLARPVTAADLDALRLLAARVVAAERVATATRRRALDDLDGRLGVRPSPPEPERGPGQEPAAGGGPAGDGDRIGGESEEEAGGELGDGGEPGDQGEPAGQGGPSTWDPRPSRRHAVAAVLVGTGAALVLAGFGVGSWIVLAALLAGLSLAARLLRVPAGTVVTEEPDAGVGQGPEVVSATERLLGHHPPEVEASDLLALAAEVPAVRATTRLVEQARARFDAAYEALGQEVGPSGRTPADLVEDLAARATAPVVVTSGGDVAGRVAAAVPAAPVLLIQLGAGAPGADEPGPSGPGSGDQSGDAGVS